MTGPSLDTFFDRAVPFLRGEAPLEELRALGPSPSADARFEFYRALMRANALKVLKSMYRTLQVALDDDSDGSFEALCDAYLKKHPPSGWDLNALAEDFPAFLETKVAADKVHPWAPAVADWAYARYQLGRAQRPEHPGLAVPASVRAYAYDIPGFERSIHGNVNARPLPSPTTLIAWRDAGNVVRHQRASAPQLVALARACDQAPQAALDALGAQALANAEAQLQQWGILAKGRPAHDDSEASPEEVA